MRDGLALNEARFTVTFDSEVWASMDEEHRARWVATVEDILGDEVHVKQTERGAECGHNNTHLATHGLVECDDCGHVFESKCQHLETDQEDEPDADGSTVYVCLSCGERWNDGAE